MKLIKIYVSRVGTPVRAPVGTSIRVGEYKLKEKQGKERRKEKEKEKRNQSP